jgi:hypothetical protein
LLKGRNAGVTVNVQFGTPSVKSDTYFTSVFTEVKCAVESFTNVWSA